MLTLQAAADTAPTLVLAVGNPSRGDDALGPLAAEQIAAMGIAGVEVLIDFQLQVEHALDLLGRRRVLFIDASAALEGPFELSPVAPARDDSYSSHAMAPAAVLYGYQQLIGPPPAAWVLAIRGEAFQLGGALGARAAAALEAALPAARSWLEDERSAPCASSAQAQSQDAC